MSKKLVTLSVIALLAAAALPHAARADDAGVFKIPGTDTTIKFNGFAETALFYEFSGGYESLASACDYYICPQGIALTSLANGGKAPNTNTPQMAMTSAYSRLGVSTNTPSSVGNIGMRFEMDAAEGYQDIGASFTHHGSIRLRHAYGTVGDTVLIGQTWTTFADLNTFPNQMDENPFVNLAALRAPMFRVSFPAGPTRITIAIEDPYDRSFKQTHFSIPDIIARIDIPASFGSFSIRGVTTQYADDVNSSQGFGGAIGAALNFAGDSLVLDVEGGSGLGTYQYGLTTGPTGEDAVEKADGSGITMWTTVGGSIGYAHNWNAQFQTNIMGSILLASGSNDLLGALGATAYNAANHSVASGGINTYWNVSKTFWTGPEFYLNYRKNFEGDSGTEFRGEWVGHFNLF